MSERFTWDWAYAAEVTPVIMGALEVTILATIYGIVLALIGGLILALLRMSPFKIIAWPASFFTEFVRSTPLLIQLFFIFYILPDYGFQASAFITGVIALGIHYSSYTAEVYRSVIEGVPKGQWEAATALNLPKARIWTSVVLPQAVPPIIPVLGNYFVAMFKETPLLSAITVVEILNRAKMIGSENFRYLEPITIVGVIFLVISLIASQFNQFLERKLKVAK